ncbi:hypothetical protein M9458_005110, partial [Cirrhinus mrigala]
LFTWRRSGGTDEGERRGQTKERDAAPAGRQHPAALNATTASILSPLFRRTHRLTDVPVNGGARADGERDEFNRPGQLISQANTKRDRSLENKRRSPPRR